MKIIDIIQTTSAATNVTSPAMDLGDIDTFSAHVDFSGGAGNIAGTLTLEAGNDGSDWVTLPTSSQAVTASASHLWSVVDAGYRYVRVKWVYTSGTGNIYSKLVAKEKVVKGA